MGKFKLTRDEYLIKRKRMSRADIAREYDITYPSLMYHLRKWNLNDITKEQIALDDLRYNPVTDTVVKLEDVVPVECEIDSLLERIKGISILVTQVSEELFKLHKGIYAYKEMYKKE